MSFKLDDAFIELYKILTPDFGPLGEIVYRRTYSRPKPDGTSEVWYETVRRVIEGMYDTLRNHAVNTGAPWDDRKAVRSAEEAYDRMFKIKWLPPGRGLWNMGTDTLARKGGAVLNNCGFYTTKDIDKDFSRPFTWLMDMLMLGVGVGMDVRGSGKATISQPARAQGAFVVQDTREGWVDLVRSILDAFSGRSRLHTFIDFSNVRVKGLPLVGMGGVSSGPGPLIDLASSLIDVLTGGRATVRQTLQPGLWKVSLYEDFEPYAVDAATIGDIANLIGKCVVSGGVRRSSEILLGEASDQTFLDLKRDEAAMRSHRWASNNSVFGPLSDYSAVASRIVENGEPGVFWIDNARAYGRMKDGVTWADSEVLGVNPCVEQSLFSGELCCLCETFPARHVDKFDYWRTLKFAYLYAKAVTLIEVHDWETDAIIKKNRRIGTSMSGIQQAIDKFGERDFFAWFCDTGYAIVQNWDEIYSSWLGVPRSIKTTSIKPSGSISLLPGATPGMHKAHSEYYIRRVRLEDTSSLIEPLIAAGYNVEQAKAEPNTVVVDIPVHESNFTGGKRETTIEEQFELAAKLQHYWADNQVSVTVTFDRDLEGWKIPKLLKQYETRLKAVSLLPLDNHGYEQAPYEEISAEEYNALVNKLSPVDFNGASAEVVEKFCDGDACTLT